MKQLLQNLKTGETSIVEVPVPESKPGRALVQTAVSLVSAGTERMLVEFGEKNLLDKALTRPDLVKQMLEKARRDGFLATVKSALNRLDEPLALGYSSAGRIVELGSGMSSFKVGQRVACAGGGYAVHAEYALVPGNLLVALPDEVDYESAAFGTLGAIGMHGFRLAEARLGEYVAVIGLGLLGFLTAQIAASAGANVLGIELNPDRIQLAEKLGIPVCPREGANDAALAFTNQRGFDVILICADATTNDPVELAGVIARDRARVVALGAVGLDLPRKIYYEKELTFINSRSYGPGRYDPAYEEKGQDYPIGYVRWTEGRNLEAVIALMAAGRLNVLPLITHRIPIDHADHAYDIITGKTKEPFLGVLLTYKEEQADTAHRVDLKSVGVQRRSPSPRGASVRLGVIGAGNFANAVMLPSIKKAGEIELIAIASASGTHAQHTGRKFGFDYSASSGKELLNDASINAIAVLTRHDSHADLAIDALKAGKHAFIEKPLAINGDQLVEISKQLGMADSPLLTVGFNRRFAPLTGKLSDFLKDRKEPWFAHYRVNAGYLPSTHWTQDHEVGGGRIVGEVCHFVDLLVYLNGTPPIRVNAHALPDGGKYNQDNVSLTLTFSDGSLAVLDYLSNGDKSYPKERLELFCAGKIAVLDDFRSLVMIENGRRRSAKSNQDKGWVNEWIAFRKAIKESGTPPIPYHQLISVTQVTFAVLESLRQNKSIDIE